ncbi:hypothetical protein TREPR_0199 [Treponema primitia ZAS-2]|uniref:Uncharacterized protein n=1 Tax=Treponema primitia (strain ATCC BAA-887 / DSM 12427 / ZAS-2) TaxID=545694 RepID=F5YMC6_TREPZ|nr:hypothetical protein TREPR_0199 [Treponema primitia ZAS-2]
MCYYDDKILDTRIFYEKNEQTTNNLFTIWLRLIRANKLVEL